MSKHLSPGEFSSGMGGRCLNVLKQHEAAIAKNVAENLFERHRKLLLPGQ
jgi:hypothetical protein